MRATLVVSLFVAVCPFGSFAGAPPSIDLAKAQLKALKYGDATKTLKQVSTAEGLSRADAIEFFLLDGLVKASLNDEQGARAAFMRALMIDPDVKLPGKAAPRVTTPFFEAKGAVRDQGRLDLTVARREATATGWVIDLTHPDDALGLISEVVLNIEEDGVARVESLPLARVGRLELKGAKARLSWRLFGARHWVLQESAPLELVAAPLVPAPPPPAPPMAIEAPPAAVIAAPAGDRPSKVPGAVVLAGGVVIAAVGAVFIGLAHLDAAAAGSVRTEMDLETAVTQGRTYQTLGFGALGVGAAAIATGLVLLIIESVSGPSVAFAPVTGGGVAVFSGRWP